MHYDNNDGLVTASAVDRIIDHTTRGHNLFKISRSVGRARNKFLGDRR